MHLEADLHNVITWAKGDRRRWAFSLSNAGAYYVEFRHDEDDLSDIEWAHVRNTDFRSQEVSESKQAEFLIHGTFPWHLVERIGVHSLAIQQAVVTITASAAHQPPVEVKRDWYY